jgi:hypothetical protein
MLAVVVWIAVATCALDTGCEEDDVDGVWCDEFLMITDHILSHHHTVFTDVKTLRTVIFC